MRKGIFYAAPDMEALEGLQSGIFSTDPVSDALVVEGGTLYSTNGVWLSKPLGAVDPETGEFGLSNPGVRSEPFVVLMHGPVAAWEDFQIDPEGVQGFA